MSTHGLLEPAQRYGWKFSSFASTFRDIALSIHENPDSIKQHFHLPAVDFLASDKNSTTLERTKYLEALSYGDPGVLLACPGPSLSGIAMRELALQHQRDYFFDTILKKKMRTCFALTEPNKGSDSSHLQATLTKKNNRFYLNGQKCFFGNGAVAEMGIVFARINDTPIGIHAILLTDDMINSPAVLKQTLPQFSLRGAQIAVMEFNNAFIPEENILGQHLSVYDSGLMSMVKIFYQYRTGVGALAIGQAQGVLDLCHEKYHTYFRLSELMQMHAILKTARDFLQHAAKKVDQNLMDGIVASSAKYHAVQAATKVITSCIDTLPLAILVSEPWIFKSYCDSFCWEFMEGTSHVLRNHVARALFSQMGNRSTRDFAVKMNAH